MKQYMMAFTAATLFFTPALAATSTTTTTAAPTVSAHGAMHRPQSRAEAIQMMEARLAELKKMSDADWEKQHAARRARHEKFHARHHGMQMQAPPPAAR